MVVPSKKKKKRSVSLFPSKIKGISGIDNRYLLNNGLRIYIFLKHNNRLKKQTKIDSIRIM